jgi:3-deoxy-manno-octulosonate cytidylyltransferase (CMP-KDO synthetase)
MRIVALIPARMGATRFPGKPLAPLLGAPMIAHVYHRTAMCREIDAVHTSKPISS